MISIYLVEIPASKTQRKYRERHERNDAARRVELGYGAFEGGIKAFVAMLSIRDSDGYDFILYYGQEDEGDVSALIDIIRDSDTLETVSPDDVDAVDHTEVLRKACPEAESIQRIIVQITNNEEGRRHLEYGKNISHCVVLDVENAFINTIQLTLEPEATKRLNERRKMIFAVARDIKNLHLALTNKNVLSVVLSVESDIAERFEGFNVANMEMWQNRNNDKVSDLCFLSAKHGVLKDTNCKFIGKINKPNDTYYACIHSSFIFFRGLVGECMIGKKRYNINRVIIECDNKLVHTVFVASRREIREYLTLVTAKSDDCQSLNLY